MNSHLKHSYWNIRYCYWADDMLLVHHTWFYIFVNISCANLCTFCDISLGNAFVYYQYEYSCVYTWIYESIFHYSDKSFANIHLRLRRIETNLGVKGCFVFTGHFHFSLFLESGLVNTARLIMGIYYIILGFAYLLFYYLQDFPPSGWSFTRVRQISSSLQVTSEKYSQC